MTLYEIKDFFIIYGTLTNKRLFFILYNNEISDKKLLLKNLNDDEINSRKLIASPYQELHNKLYLASKNLLKSYDLEESVNKSFDAIKKNIPTSRFITKEDSDLIHKIGLAGEELINRYLIEKKNNREIKDFYWLSKDQPDADHDFEITDVEGKVKYIEVKTSKSGFETPFYWSMNEIKLFLNYPNNYIIKRISNIFNDQQVTLFSGEEMLSLHNKLNIDGIFFDGSIYS